MMDVVRAIVLGVVEGATEFIPVSSTGHLILVGHWIGFIGARANVFEIVIQLGAILAVVWQYRSVLLGMTLDAVMPGKRHSAEGGSRRLMVALAVAFLPAAVVGFLTHRWITAHLFTPRVVATALVVGGIAMWAIEARPRRVRVDRVAAIPLSTALGIGIAQIASLVPGTSRSAATILGALLFGVARPAAAEFSFLLAIPIMVAATALGLTSNLDLLRVSDAPIFIAGFATAFVAGLISIRLLLRFVTRHDFRSFAIYRIVLGAILLALIARGGMG